MNTPRRSRRLAGLEPEELLSTSHMTVEYYPNHIPRHPTTCSYLLAALSSILSFSVILRVATASCNQCL